MGKNFCSDRDFQSLIQILTIENVYGIIENGNDDCILHKGDHKFSQF